MKTELWKVVKGFSSYEVSNLGRVRNSKGKILTPDKTGVSTLGRVFLKNSKVRKTLGVSTLMCENWKWEWIKDLEEGEEVKPIRGCPQYFITNRGRVFSLNTYVWCEPSPYQNYYYQVGVRDSFGTPKNFCIHTLVGRHFLPEWEEGLCILHHRETLSYPEINYPNNLWIGTKGDNNRDREKKGRGRWR